MATYGVTDSGFILKRLQQIADEMRAKAQDQLPGIDTSVDSVPGTLIDVVSDASALQWQLAEETYNARYPSSGEGVQLDRIGQINAILRRKPQKSTVRLGCEGVNGTIIQQGKQVKSDKGDIYLIQTEASLDNTATNRVEVEVVTVLDTHTYTIFIDSNSVDYLSSGAATKTEITNGVIAAINAQTSVLLVEADEIDSSLGTFYITSNDGENPFEVGLNADYQLNKFWTPIRINAEVAGPLESGPGTITTIITPIAGLNSVDNFTDVTIGDNLQSDDNYRLSLYQEVRRLGGGSLEAIKDRLLNTVEDVILVRGFENHTMIIDPVSLRPPKSIEMLVEGGTNQDIADELWIAKGGGIETFGNESVIVTDSGGKLHNIKFSRPTKAYIWFKITITINADFPADGENQIEEAVVLKGRETFGIGDELIIQQFYCPIYSVPGVETALIEIQKTSDLTPPVSYVTTNLTLLDDESPLFDVSRVEVINP